ncbi:MAG: TRAP transporter substrate-binding protein [Bauldia sp.]|nr:TRAP transporter substrate-binding protein [Bauldia sp.]
MDRRSFFRGAGIATVAAAASALAAPAIAQERRELRMATPWPAGLPGLDHSVNRLVRRISEMTDGRITVVPFNAGALVPALEEFAAASDGRADLFHGPDYYYAAASPALNFFTNTPLGLTAIEHAAWLRFGGGQELWDRHHAQFGLKPLLAGNTGTQMAGWFKQPIESLAGIAGLNFRMPGLGGEVWRRLGMNVISLPGAEILAALQDGRLDGADWIGPWNDREFRLHEAASHYYSPSLAEGSATLGIGINSGVWQSLSGADRATFEIACEAEHQAMLAEFHHNNAVALEELTATHGVTVHALPPDIVAAIADATHGVIADTAGSDPLANEIVASIAAARRRLRRWTETGEGTYVAARAGTADW